MSEGKVIGYLAYVTKLQLICEGDSCIIAGSREKMESYIKQFSAHQNKRVTITKARFGDIKRALQLGASYSFDEDAYSRFHPLAVKAGITAGSEEFTAEAGEGVHFVRVRRK